MKDSESVKISLILDIHGDIIQVLRLSRPCSKQPMLAIYIHDIILLMKELPIYFEHHEISLGLTSYFQDTFMDAVNWLQAYPLHVHMLQMLSSFLTKCSHLSPKVDQRG